MMKWKVAGALMCVLSLVGCHNDVEKPVSQQRVTVDTPRGKVMLQDAIQDLDDKVVTATVIGGDINATFRMISTGDDESVVGGRAELVDPSGQLLFSIEARIDNATGEVVMTEATADDYLTFSISGDDERVHERYDANGDVAAFDYPALPDETQRRALNYYQHGLPASRLPDDVSEYMANLASFEAYYAPHSNNTLHNNPSGELLVDILTAPEFPGLVAGDGQDPHMLQWIQQTCSGARACAGLMCRINPAGVICDVCWAVALACSIFETICSWFGC